MVLRVRLLGGLDVEGIEYARLGSRKSRRLLARLALGRGRPVAAEALVEVVWPGDHPARPGDQLSVLVSRLRSVLGAPRLPRVGEGYALSVDWLDVDALAELVAEARRRLAAGTLAPARAAADAALALTRGTLLPQESPADWLDAERTAAQRMSAAARLVSAEVALEGGDAWTAAQAAAAALAAEPYDEVALRLLMAASASAGRPAQAILAYTEVARRLRDDLGVDPARQTTDLYVDLLRADRASPPVAPVVGARAVLPGRAEPLRSLDEAYARAAGGTTVLVRVEGEPGIGKTRLLDVWTTGLPPDATVLRASGWELGGSLPMQALLDAVAVYVRGLAPETVATLFDGPAAILAPLVGQAGPGVGSPTGDRGEDAATGAVAVLADHSGTGPTLLFAGLDAVLTRLGGSGPVVLVIDDGHWLDRTTLAWLRRPARPLGDMALLIVVAHRPDEAAARALPVAPTVNLATLDAAVTAEIVGPDRAEAFHARSGGHPLFLMELVHSGDVDALPATIRAAVAERCERAGAAGVTLRWAAVLGPDVDLDLLASALDTPPGEILDHLEEGVRRHLLVEHGTFQFRHQLIREALRAEVGATRTAWLHRQAARSLSARTGQADPLDVAYHARLGGDLVQTALALCDAAELAAARFDHGAALELFDEALAAYDVPAVRLRRARVALPAGRFGDASADAAAAIAAGAGAEAMEIGAIAAYCLRDFPACRRLSDEGARLADDPRLRTSCQALGGRVCHVDGDLAGADRRLRVARDTAAPGMRALADLWYAPLLIDRGDPAMALELLRDPTLVQAARHPFVLPHRHLAAAQALATLGRVDEAMAELSAVDEVAAGQRTGRFTARAANCRAWILRNLDAAEEADALNRDAYERSIGVVGMTEPVVDALLGLADGRLRAGETADARGLLHRVGSEGAAPHPFRWRHELRRRWLAGRCAVLDGDHVRAADLASEILAEARRLDVPRYVALARLLAGLAGSLDAEDVRADVDGLHRTAPLEAWWLTAEMGRALRVEQWRDLAASRRIVLTG